MLSCRDGLISCVLDWIHVGVLWILAQELVVDANLGDVNTMAEQPAVQSFQDLEEC